MTDELLNPPRGMRDITGDEAELYYTLFKLFYETAERNGFEPIITPTVEYYRVFEAKSGEEIKKSMYVFEDKAGRLLALRPEVTASVIRVYLRELRARPKPIRVFYIAQCFRYEEPQKARYREFWQGGLEVIGDESVNADVSVAYTASAFLDKLGLAHRYIVGNVAIYRAFMSMLNIAQEEQDHILHLIDKELYDQLGRELVEKYGNDAKDIIFKIMDSGLDKVMSLLEEFRRELGNGYEKAVNEARRLEGFIKTLSDLGYTVEYNSRLVRGLAYYTGLIWEYKVPGALEQSIGGGGRYDGLTSVYSNIYEYSTGLALGLDRIALVLGGDWWKRVSKRRRVIIILLSENIPLSFAYSVSRQLDRFFDSIMVLTSRSLDKALSYANRIGIDIAIIVGDREFSEKTLTVRDLNKKVQEKIRFDELTDYISRIIQ
ncbi:histidine--tRNA ligase [Thermogladius sp. 4427co]|uniref:histidine--tRNA ligase n=1 Tax=Thermogladius sp. 4427co TaxID=3450718 RepID=UPI003F79819A